MRRGSLIGPVLLILIGGMVLFHNIRPEFGALELLAAYWPLLLVLWGALRLIEILLLAVRSRRLPRSGITGGEWALVVLVCLFAGGVDFARNRLPLSRFQMGGVEIFGDAYDFRTAASQPADEATRLRVENLNGNVRIVGGDTEEIRVERRTTVRALDAAVAKQAHEECPLEAITQGDQIVVRTNQERRQGTTSISSDLDIVVPQAFSVEVIGRNGDFDVSNMTGDVDLESDRGGARLADIGGSARMNLRRSDIVRVLNLQGNVTLEGQGRNVDLESVGGMVEIKGGFSGEVLARDIAQPLQFESSRTQLHVEQLPGELRMASGEVSAHRLVGPIRLTTRSQDVRLTDFTGGLSVEIERGNIELRPEQIPLTGIDVEIRSGDIEIAIPSDAGSGLFARTNGGDITNDYDPALKLEQNGREATLSGPDAGEPLVRLHTERGDVTVRKALASPTGVSPLVLERH